MSGLAARNGGRVGLAALAAILLLGLALRVGYAWEGRDPVFDAVAYGQIAANLESGDGFTLGAAATQPAGNYSPGLPLLVAGLYEVAGGEHERFARLALALVGSLAILFAYLIGRRLAASARLTRERSSGAVAGLVGAGVVAVYPALLEYQGMLMSEPLAATLLSGAVLSILWAADAGPAASARGSCRGGRGDLRAGASSPPLPPHHPRVRWVVPGLLLGGLALVRPEYLGVAVLLVLVVLASGSRDEWRGSLARAAVMLAGVVLVVAPWTARNAIALDRLVPISTGGGQVLFAGSYLPSDGDPERVGGEVLERHPELRRALPAEPRLEQILAALAAQRYPDLETDRALGRMGRERLWDAISGQPLDYAGFLATKLGRLWSPGPRAVMRKPGWTLFHWALLAFGLAGLTVLVRRRCWEVVPILTVLVAITAISAVLVASPRRALVMLPLLAALAGVGMTACRDSLAKWKR